MRDTIKVVSLSLFPSGLLGQRQIKVVSLSRFPSGPLGQTIAMLSRPPLVPFFLCSSLDGLDGLSYSRALVSLVPKPPGFPPIRFGYRSVTVLQGLPKWLIPSLLDDPQYPVWFFYCHSPMSSVSVSMGSGFNRCLRVFCQLTCSVFGTLV